MARNLENILEPAIAVRSSGRLDDMRRGRFADAQVEKRGHNGRVENIARVDESLGRRVRELGEAGGGQLGGDEGAGRVDVEVFGEIGELEREGVLGRVRGHCSGFTDST